MTKGPWARKSLIGLVNECRKQVGVQIHNLSQLQALCWEGTRRVTSSEMLLPHYEGLCASNSRTETVAANAHFCTTRHPLSYFRFSAFFEMPAFELAAVHPSRLLVAYDSSPPRPLPPHRCP